MPASAPAVTTIWASGNRFERGKRLDEGVRAAAGVPVQRRQGLGDGRESRREGAVEPLVETERGILQGGRCDRIARAAGARASVGRTVRRRSRGDEIRRVRLRNRVRLRFRSRREIPGRPSNGRVGLDRHRRDRCDRSDGSQSPQSSPPPWRLRHQNRPPAETRPITASQRSGCRFRGRRANDRPSPATNPASAAAPRLRISRRRYHQPNDIARAFLRALFDSNISASSVGGGWPGRVRPGRLP